MVAATLATDICAPAKDEASIDVAKAPATKRENLDDFIYFVSLIALVKPLGDWVNEFQV